MTSRSNMGRDGSGGPGPWSRRLFLKVSVAAAGAVALGIGGWSRRDSIGRLLAPGPDAQESLSPEELDEVALISEVLFEPEDEQASQELAATMRWWAEGSTERGPHLDLYRDGLRALASATHGSHPDTAFRELNATQRSALIASLMGTGAEGPFKELASELLYGIYSSAPGWQSLGYTTWPGVPSPPLEYTRRPGAPPNPRAAASSRGVAT